MLGKYSDEVVPPGPELPFEFGKTILLIILCSCFIFVLSGVKVDLLLFVAVVKEFFSVAALATFYLSFLMFLTVLC